MVGTQFYSRKEVKDFRLLAGGRQQRRCVQRQKNNQCSAAGHRQSFFLTNWPAKNCRRRSKRNLSSLRICWTSLTNYFEPKTSAAIAFVLKATGLEEFLENGDGRQGKAGKLLRELVSIATRYDHPAPPEGTDKNADGRVFNERPGLYGGKKENSIRLMTRSMRPRAGIQECFHCRAGRRLVSAQRVRRLKQRKG